MNNVTSLAVDLAKNIFQLYGINRNGKTIIERRVRRNNLLECVANMGPCNIYMEGCGSANYWGREFIKLGHRVQLINPKYVKPYVKRNKNDKNDAYAIASAASDPKMTFSSIKSEAQQDMQSTHRIRQQLIGQRTALSNQIRGLLSEYGIIMPQGLSYVRKKLPIILGDNGSRLSELMLINVQELYENFVQIDDRIGRYNNLIEQIYKGDEVSKKLGEIPGVGKLGATILSAVLGNNGAGFKNGRHFAAFLGLVPRQSSSGNREKLLGVSKQGDTYIRTLLIHGARAVIKYANKKGDNNSMWLNTLKMRSGVNIAAVAMANKIARMAWAIVHYGTGYDANHKPKTYETA